MQIGTSEGSKEGMRNAWFDRVKKVRYATNVVAMREAKIRFVNEVISIRIKNLKDGNDYPII